MIKSKTLAVVVLLFFTVMLLVSCVQTPSNTSSSQWKIVSEKDPMTGKETWYAISPKVKSLKPMSFPYNDTEAWIGIGNDGTNEWIYIGFSTIPNIEDFNIGNGYLIITTRVKWDELEPNYTTFYQKVGSNFLHFADYTNAISKVMQHKKFLLELNWYGNGLVHFEFPLEGAKEAIETIRSKFRN